jgi:hypothetical protein
MVSSLKAQYDENGFVIVPGLVSPEERLALEDACKTVISKTRSGEWSHRRTVGKQFPPFDNENPDSWGVQHIMHPDLNEPVFAKWYTSDPLISAAKQLLGCREEDLQMGESCMHLPILKYIVLMLGCLQELFNLLINPLSHHFALASLSGRVAELPC